MITEASVDPKWRFRGLLFAAVLAIVGYYTLGFGFSRTLDLDLGSMNVPTPGYLNFVTLWWFCGGIAALLLAKALATSSFTPTFERLKTLSDAVPQRKFLFGACLAAFIVPLTLRLTILREYPVADDESAYRFAAELLATGRLWVDSPSLKLFFDQNFMINDGRLYPAYFLGWPALLTPGIWLGAPSLMNPVLSALTIPALMLSLSHYVGQHWVRAGVVLFISSPLLQIGAATQLSHTSCFMALAWALAMHTRLQEFPGRLIDHAGLGFALSFAFCIRPQATIPFAVPLVIAWCLVLTSVSTKQRLHATGAFVGAAAILLTPFFFALWAQNGAPWRTGYARSAEFLRENDFLFTTFTEEDLTPVAGFDFDHMALGIVRTGFGLLRLNFDLFGWPSCFLLLGFALSTSKQTWVLWAMTAAYLLFHLFQHDWGIDTFGPTHAFELGLPILILNIIGLRNLSVKPDRARRGDGGHGEKWSRLAPALLVSLIVSAWMGFVPVRLYAIHKITTHIGKALSAPAQAGLHDAVIFAPWPLAPSCRGVPHHFVFFRPTNDPDLRNDILWVNHIDVFENQRLMETLPGRTGYIMNWTLDCHVSLRTLSSATPENTPAGPTRMTDWPWQGTPRLLR